MRPVPSQEEKPMISTTPAYASQLAAVAAALLVAACANTPTAPGTAYQSATDEVARAAAERSSRERPAAVDRALVAPPVVAPPALPQVPEPRFDLAVSNAPAAQVFMALVSGTRFSMLLPPDLEGLISVNLKDVTVREALDTLRELYGYEYKVVGTRIFVQSNTLQTRLFQISYLANRRVGQSSTRVISGSISDGRNNTTSSNATTTSSSGSQNRTLESTNIVTSTSNDFWGELTGSMSALLGCELRSVSSGNSAVASGGAGAGNAASPPSRSEVHCPGGRSLVVNTQAGIVVARAFPGELRELIRFLKAMQVAVERQVMLEAKIIDVQLNEGAQNGINWSAFDSRGGHRFSVGANTDRFAFPGGQPLAQDTGTTDAAGNAILIPSTLSGATTGILSSPIAGVLGLAFQTRSFAALLSFLETQGNVSVLSSPRIATLNNQKAVLKVGTDEYFVTNVSSSTTSVSTSGATSVASIPEIVTQPFFSGIALDVTPQIDDDANIILHIRPSVSSVAERTKQLDLGAQGNFRLPLAQSTVSETDSIVRVRDGNIVAIGGLMTVDQREGRSVVPGLGDVPILSAFFKRGDKSFNKRELVILLKPTVIHSDREWQDDLIDTTRRLRTLDPRRPEPASQ